MRLLARENVESESQKAVAGEDRGGLVVFAMRGRLAPAQFVIIHGRQIVMHQRVAMHAFERRARHQRVLPRHAEKCRRFNHQERPEALAAAQARIAHGLDQAGGTVYFAGCGLGREQPVEQGLGLRRNGVEVGKKGAFGVH